MTYAVGDQLERVLIDKERTVLWRATILAEHEDEPKWELQTDNGVRERRSTTDLQWMYLPTKEPRQPTRLAVHLNEAA